MLDTRTFRTAKRRNDYRTLAPGFSGASVFFLDLIGRCSTAVGAKKAEKGCQRPFPRRMVQRQIILPEIEQLFNFFWAGN